MEHSNSDDAAGATAAIAAAGTPLSSLQRRRKSRALRLSSEVPESSTSTSADTPPSLCVSRSSWFQDAFQQQGMSEEDIHEFLGDVGGSGGGGMDDGGVSEFETSERGGIHLPLDEMAEQHKFMAIYEAKKLLDRNVGYDVAEAAKKIIEQDEERSSGILSPPTFAYSCYPEKPMHTVSPESSGEYGRSLPKRRMQPKFDVPVADASGFPILGRSPPKHKVAYGTVVDNSEDDWKTSTTEDDEEEEENEKILSHCENCKVLLAVPLQVILAVCPKCDVPIH